jgi:hypothetical protein
LEEKLEKKSDEKAEERVRYEPSQKAAAALG